MSNKVMYILVNEDVKLEKDVLAKHVGNAVELYIYKNYIEKYCFNSNDNVHQRYLMLKNYMQYQTKSLQREQQDYLENLESRGHITIRDKGFTQLEPNSLTCVNKGIVNNTMNILINNDIKIGKGKLAGQIGHATCTYLYRRYIRDYEGNLLVPSQDEKISELDDYMQLQKKIVLKCTKQIICSVFGIIDKDTEEVPNWIQELKLYSR